MGGGRGGGGGREGEEGGGGGEGGGEGGEGRGNKGSGWWAEESGGEEGGTRVSCREKGRGDSMQRGANGLQCCVVKATGVELPIVTEDKAPADGVRISIGHTKLAEQAGITTDDLKLDSCKLIVKGDVLFLIGRDGAEAEKHKTPRGSCRAVVTFLEEFVGVR